MNTERLFNAGPGPEFVPLGDVARQAVNSLRGYEYQTLAATLAWVELDSNSRLFLEIAEDYAVVAEKALRAVQVKDTGRSGTVTLISDSVREAVASFVDLVERNADAQVHLRFLTTSSVGLERAATDRPGGVPGLEYWGMAAAGADCNPLREILESERFPEPVRAFCKVREDATLRRELVRRIHWDCGKPDASTLRKEIEARLIVLGRDRFGLPYAEARRLVDPLAYRVLQASSADDREDRVLALSDLYKTIDGETRMSVSRAAVGAIEQFALRQSPWAEGERQPETQFSGSRVGWLMDGAELPEGRGTIARKSVEGAAAEVLMEFGTVVVVGGSGVGKSTLSRAVVIGEGEAYSVVDLRHSEPSEARDRLDLLFTRIGDLGSTTLIVEDLNCLDNGQVAMACGRVLESLRRRYGRAVITCYRRPAPETLSRIGLDGDQVIECPYFSVEETAELVTRYGGDASTWGSLAHFAGGNGHPQLTHAFVMGMAREGWPSEQIEKVIGQGLSTEDTDAARDAARRNLLSALPEGARNLLYRLSLVAGHFSRELALYIGGMAPEVPQPGECLDRLIGPWIEAAGQAQFRVSPLASAFGREMLGADEQKRIHKTIARQMLASGSIDAIDVNTMLLHAIWGESTTSLAVLTQNLMTADADTRNVLAENVPTLRLLRTDRQIYPGHAALSIMLRIVQFKLAAALDRSSNIAGIVAALFNEIGEMADDESKRILEEMVLIQVLSTIGIAKHLDNWVALLVRMKSMVEANSYLQSLAANVERSDETRGSNYLAMLFSIGSAGLGSVSELEKIVDELDTLDADERSLLLTPMDRSASDYSVLINTPWAAEQGRDDFDPSETAFSYQRMAEKTGRWGIRPLTLQCFVARGVMLDEYLDDREGAFAALDEGVAIFGSDLILTRAKAKVYWRRGEHREALDILRGIADRIGLDNPVERVTALREAAISAARCDEWAQAEAWFLEAATIAQSLQSEDRLAVEVGLRADSAVAALERGEVGCALERLTEAVSALDRVDPDQTLRTAYCYRVIGHTVSWAWTRIKGDDTESDEEEFEMQPGACSNPDPLPEIRELPLGHIDVPLYLLAQAEAAAGIDVGIRAGLEERLVNGTIPAMEVLLRRQEIQSDIERLNPTGFSNHLTAYVEAQVFFSAESTRLNEEFDPLAPERGKIPALATSGESAENAERAANDAILGYLVRCVTGDRLRGGSELEEALNGRLGGKFRGSGVFDRAKGKSNTLAELDRIVVGIVDGLSQSRHVAPDAFWDAGLRFFEWIDQSNFRECLVPHLAAWQRQGWGRILAVERFRLTMPMRTAPGIEEVLAIPSNDQAFLARLLLKTAPAVGARLSRSYQKILLDAAGSDE